MPWHLWCEPFYWPSSELLLIPAGHQCASDEDYPELLGAVREHFVKIKEEFLKSFEHRGGKLTLLEEEHDDHDDQFAHQRHCQDLPSDILPKQEGIFECL